jgi:2-methylcitrate dehydratase PrpD
MRRPWRVLTRKAPDAAGLGATQLLASYVAGLDGAALGERRVAAVRRLLLDACCAMLAGSTSDNVTAACALYQRDAPSGRGAVVSHGTGFGVEPAALLNGMSAHERGIDDFHAPSRTHPGAAVVPAVLAAAEIAGADWADAGPAIAAGYDVTSRISLAVGVRGLFERGFHPGAVCGALGAAAGAGRVLRLPPAQLLSALCLAASQASGLLTWEDDPTHVVKSFQLGTAARAGVTAALFAAQGLAPQVDVLTGRHSLLRAVGGEVDPAAFDDLGQRYTIDEMTLKRHAGCGQLHAAIDAVISIREQEDVRPEQIDAIEVHLADDALAATDHTPLLTHNLQYVVAVAAATGSVLPDHFGPAWTADPVVRELAGRVTGHADPSLQQRFPEYQSAIVVVRTPRGSTRREVPMPLGGPRAPLDDTALRAKTQTMAGRATSGACVDAVLAALGADARNVDVTALIRALAAAGPERPATAPPGSTVNR